MCSGYRAGQLRAVSDVVEDYHSLQVSSNTIVGCIYSYYCPTILLLFVLLLWGGTAAASARQRLVFHVFLLHFGAVGFHFPPFFLDLCITSAVYVDERVCLLYLSIFFF